MKAPQTATATRPPKGINVKLLLAVKRAILEEPRRINMDISIKRKTTGAAPRCGTVGCIAGWALVLDALSKRPHKAMTRPVMGEVLRGLDKAWDSSVLPNAEELLRLTVSQADRLFYVWNWPASLRIPYRAAQFEQHPDTVKDHEAAARITARRIDLFIQTEGRQ